MYLVVAAILAGGAAATVHQIPLPWNWSALAGVNVATFLLLGYDKAIAGGRRLRVPEVVLHLLTFLGGTPAAFIGQGLFRHKTRKGSFQAVFWLIVFLQLALVGFWLWCWKTRPPWMPEIFKDLFPRG